MSSEDFKCKICGGCAESRPDGEVEIIETSEKENESDGGKGSKEREVSEKETEEGKETQKRNTHSEEKIGGNNHKGNNKLAREFVKIEPNKQELTNRRLKKA